MTARNDVTGDAIQTKTVTDSYRNNFDKIFKKEQKVTWNIVELDVIRWSEARGIIPNSTSKAQLTKAYEEMNELSEAISNRDRDGIVDGLGDVLVCLINIAALEDFDLTQCLKAAYEQIKDRKGYMNADGIFVKET